MGFVYRWLVRLTLPLKLVCSMCQSCCTCSPIPDPSATQRRLGSSTQQGNLPVTVPFPSRFRSPGRVVQGVCPKGRQRPSEPFKEPDEPTRGGSKGA